MSVKQDRVAPRTVDDLERKYNFGKSFAEVLGLIDDTRKDIDSVESTLKDKITEQETTLRRNTKEIVAETKATITKETDGKLEEIRKDVDLKLDADGLSLAIQEEVSGGISLKTGYTFDSDGLRIAKSGEAVENLLDNTGMYVNRSGGENVLTANEKGVKALDLHAETYLIVGDNSRFEDYGINRTGCFWIGG